MAEAAMQGTNLLIGSTGVKCPAQGHLDREKCGWGGVTEQRSPTSTDEVPLSNASNPQLHLGRRINCNGHPDLSKRLTATLDLSRQMKYHSQTAATTRIEGEMKRRAICSTTEAAETASRCL
ncbi:hypothetical protein AALO_G00224790 [Alosa alosa]|uniref:Uncharacterized protein n=1 Tax=Alosa alosa TaxID=278164 RepID=A0AAV6G2V3_9TELE|nr:hypothetical protein AALO_G00224790 [Alosa alosa]